MSPAAGLPAVGWRLLVGGGRGASISLGLLVLVTVFVAVVLPRANTSLRTNALRQVLAGLPASADTVTAGIDYADYAGSASITGQLSATQKQLAGFLADRGVPVRAGRAWTGLMSGSLAVTGAPRQSYVDDAPPQLQLGFSPQLSRNATLASGRWPGAATTHDNAVSFQIVVTTVTASRFGLHLGSRLRIGAADSVVVSGLLRPVAPGSAFWSQFASLADPALIATTTGGYWTGGGFVGPAEAMAMADPRLTSATVTWVFPLDLSQVTASQAGPLLAVLTAAASQGPAQVASLAGSGASFALSSGATPLVSTFVSAQATAGGIAALLFVSLAVLGILVLLMATQLLAQSRRPEFATMLARGANRRQLAWLAVRGNALVTLPAAAFAAALAVLVTPGGQTGPGWGLAASTTACALAAPGLLALPPGAGQSAGGRRSGRRVAQVRRLVLEIALTGAAVAGLVVIRQEGLSSGGGVNALTAAAPVLAAVPAAVAVIRLWPILTRLLLRVARRGTGLIAFVGLARGADRAHRGLLPVFALVLALAVLAFGGAIATGLSQGEAAAAWQQTGADAVVGSPSGTTALTVQAQQAIRGVRGVGQTAAVIEQTGQTGIVAGGTPFNVAVVDPRQYAGVLAGTPATPFPAAALSQRAGPLPVLASPAAAALLRQAGAVVTIGLRTVRVRVAGQIASTPAAPDGAPFLILPLWAAGPRPLPPTMMLLAGHQISSSQLTAVVARTAPGATVMVRSVLAAQLASAPLPRATLLEYAVGSAAAAAFGLIILLIALFLSAPDRQFTDARLATMGVSPAQARRAGLVEVIPMVLAAVAGGTAAAAVLAPLLGPVLSLSALTGSLQGPQLQTGVLTPVLTGAGLMVLALGLMAGQAAAARRRGLSLALRAGDGAAERST